MESSEAKVDYCDFLHVVRVGNWYILDEKIVVRLDGGQIALPLPPGLHADIDRYIRITIGVPHVAQPSQPPVE